MFNIKRIYFFRQLVSHMSVGRSHWHPLNRNDMQFLVIYFSDVQHKLNSYVGELKMMILPNDFTISIIFSRKK